MEKRISPRVVCAYLYIINKYGYPPPAEGSVDYLAQMKALGFQSVELEGIREEHLLKVYGLRKEIASFLRKEKLKMPVFCAVLPGLGSAEKEIRDHNIALVRKACVTASECGAECVLDNSPLPPYVFPKDIPVTRHYDFRVVAAASLPGNFDAKRYMRDLAATYRKVCSICAEYGLTYQMHPAVGVFASHADGFLNLASQIKAKNLRFNLDTANQFCQKENVILALHRLKGFVDYIHLSDNRGERPEHLQIGEGEIHWDGFFRTLKKLKYKGRFGIDIECKNLDKLDEVYILNARKVETLLAGSSK